MINFYSSIRCCNKIGLASLKQQSNSPLCFPLKVKNRLERSVEVRVEVTRKQGFSKHRFDRVFFFQDSNSPRQSGLSSRTGKSLFSELTASVFTSLGKYRADLEWLSLSFLPLSSSGACLQKVRLFRSMEHAGSG